MAVEKFNLWQYKIPSSFYADGVDFTSKDTLKFTSVCTAWLTLEAALQERGRVVGYWTGKDNEPKKMPSGFFMPRDRAISLLRENFYYVARHYYYIGDDGPQPIDVNVIEKLDPDNWLGLYDRPYGNYFKPFGVEYILAWARLINALRYVGAGAFESVKTAKTGGFTLPPDREMLLDHDTAFRRLQAGLNSARYSQSSGDASNSFAMTLTNYAGEGYGGSGEKSIYYWKISARSTAPDNGQIFWFYDGRQLDSENYTGSAFQSVPDALLNSAIAATRYDPNSDRYTGGVHCTTVIDFGVSGGFKYQLNEEE